MKDDRKKDNHRKVSRREKRVRKARKTVDTPTGLTASAYVWGPEMLQPLIEWAQRLGYTYTLNAQIEDGNPNIQVVFRTHRDVTKP